MAIDKRATRLGVLALVGTLLFSLIGARLWFLQTVEQEALQQKVEHHQAAHRPVAARTRPDLRRRRSGHGRQPARAHGRGRLVGVAPRQATAPRSSGACRAGSTCPSRTWRRGSRARCTARSCRCPWPRTSTNARPPRSERVEDLPGVSIVEESRHVYPYAPLASHVVGYMGRITSDTKDTYTSAGYYLNERVGQFGVELSMEDELHGKWGFVTYEVDNASRIVREVDRVPAINGNDIQLTIDLDQQQFAEEALETQLETRRLQFGAQPRSTPRRTSRRRVFPGFPRRRALQGTGGRRGRPELPERSRSSPWRATRRSTTGGSNPTSATASSRRCSRPWSIRSPARSIPTPRR